jgi:hypothetical protein
MDGEDQPPPLALEKPILYSRRIPDALPVECASMVASGQFTLKDARLLADDDGEASDGPTCEESCSSTDITQISQRCSQQEQQQSAMLCPPQVPVAVMGSSVSYLPKEVAVPSMILSTQARSKKEMYFIFISKD